MYKYTYLPQLTGSAVISDVEFGPEKYVIINTKLDRLKPFVDMGMLSCEVYDPKAPKVVAPPTPAKRGRKPKVVEVQPEPKQNLISNLPPLEEVDMITKAVMGM